MLKFAIGTLLAVLFSAVSHGGDKESKPLPPSEARKKIGQSVTVEMTVRASKDRLEKRGEIYLGAETDFRDAKNFAVVITKAGAKSLGEAGISNPAEHFKDKKIRATGTVKEVDKVPRIEIDEAKQIRMIEAPKVSCQNSAGHAINGGKRRGANP